MYIIAIMSLINIGQNGQVVNYRDPLAVQAMLSMKEAYAKVQRYQMETTYSGPDAKLINITRASISIERPNRVYLEIVRTTPERPIPTTTRIVCDGKYLYTYLEARAQYTRIPAPKLLSDMNNIAAGLEMSALTGSDPFAEMVRTSQSMTLLGTAPVDNVQTEVVEIINSEANKILSMRLFIGQSDHLLRRMEYAARFIQVPVSSVGQFGAEELPALDPPRPIQFAYQNRLRVDQKITNGTFDWVKPAGVALLEEQSLAPVAPKSTGKKVKKGASPILGVPEGTKIYTLEETLKNAKKNNKP